VASRHHSRKGGSIKNIEMEETTLAKKSSAKGSKKVLKGSSKMGSTKLMFNH